MLRDDLFHFLAQLAHLNIAINGTKQFHEPNPVMRGKGLIATRIEFAGDLLDEFGKYRHVLG